MWRENVCLTGVPEAVQRDRGSKYILRKIPTYNWYSPVGLTATLREREQEYSDADKMAHMEPPYI